MQFITDLHLHSKYSRAVSQDMTLPIMATWGKKKGIDILSTGDWTHPLWFREIRGQLEEKSEGLFQLKTQSSNVKSTSQNSPAKRDPAPREKLEKEPFFLLSVDVSSIYRQAGQTRRIHNLILSPSFETAEKINKELLRRGCNLMADGRPIIGLSAKDLLELVLAIDKTALLIPCHAWTPWFSLYGSMSGFDSIEECFGPLSKYIYGVETGLSSDPEMNWRINELENRSILSFSDAHSPAKMGREATVFELPELSYAMLRQSIVAGPAVPHIAYTLEFYPEEGKYHYTGHRNCKVVQTPEETKVKGSQCPVCGRILTVGVMHRVEQLAKSEIRSTKFETDRFGVRWIHDAMGKHPPFVKLVPLLEILAEALSSTTASIKVREAFDKLVSQFSSELDILLKTDTREIEKLVGPKIAEGIEKVRKGDIAIAPGFDGEYGKVKIWSGIEDQEEVASTKKEEQAQLGLF